MDVKIRRSLLFVPGSYPERFNKAISSNADMVCFDLEDSVNPDQKESARNNIIDHLQQTPCSIERVIRINQVTNDYGNNDLASMSMATVKPEFIILPKIENANEVIKSAQYVNNTPIKLIALIETPKGLLNAENIAKSHPSLEALMFGGADMSNALGGEITWESLLYARSHLAMVASAYNLEIIDMPYLNLEHQDGLREETQKVKAMGYTTKSAIHPKQIDTINKSYNPSKSQIEKAINIVNFINKNKTNIAVLDGIMIDKPIIKLAQRTIAIAKSAGLMSTP